MKTTLRLVLVALTFTAFLSAQTRIYQHGTVVRMRMTQCSIPHSDVMARLAGVTVQDAGNMCQEYTLTAQNVVYEVVGRHTTDLIPLAEDIEFRLQKNELLVRIDDIKHETRFYVIAMTLRSDWERHELEQRKDTEGGHPAHKVNAQLQGSSE